MTSGAIRPVPFQRGTEEIELKYRIDDPATADRLLRAERLGTFAAGPAARPTRIEDRYMDTADRALARAGYAVRLRQRGRDTVVSVKSLGRSRGNSGAVRRQEVEGPAYRPSPPIDWPPSAARTIVVEYAGGAPLVELVAVRQVRTVRLLRSAGTRVELSVDQVEVVSDGEILDAFTELEAELVRGDEAALDKLADRLAMEPGLTAENGSKFDAAMAAMAAITARHAIDVETETPDPDTTVRDAIEVDPAPGITEPEPPPAEIEAPAELEPPPAEIEAPGITEPEPPPAEIEEAPARIDEQPERTAVISTARAVGVAADDHIAEAGRKVMRFHLGRMLEREAGVRSGLDPADVHKMRVATRRQRAAWRIFGDAFESWPTRPYRRGLRALARRLGAVRDIDVQLEAADRYRSDRSEDEPAALEPLLEAFRTHRDAARVALVRELDSDRYRHWIDSARDLVLIEGVFVRSVGLAEPHRVRDTAPSRIWAAHEAVRAYEPVLAWADVPTLHELRIAAKWLRYSMEFVSDALADEATALIGDVTALQDHLGELQDAEVTATMARQFLVDRGGVLSTGEVAAIGRYLADRERQVARLRRSVGPPWHAVADRGFRDALGGVLAAV